MSAQPYQTYAYLCICPCCGEEEILCASPSAGSRIMEATDQDLCRLMRDWAPAVERFERKNGSRPRLVRLVAVEEIASGRTH